MSVIVASGVEFLVDKEDVDKLSKYSWSLSSDKKYSKAWASDLNSFILMHRYLMGNPLGFLVDHKDRNTFDCRKKNLRIATHSQNLCNRGAQKNNKLGIKGVVKKGNKFCSHIRVNNKQVYLGTFRTPEEAHEIYMKAAKKYHGEFASG